MEYKTSMKFRVQTGDPTGLVERYRQYGKCHLISSENGIDTYQIEGTDDLNRAVKKTYVRVLEKAGFFDIRIDPICQNQ